MGGPPAGSLTDRMTSSTASPGAPARGAAFRYEGYDLDPAARRLTCRYSLDGRTFTEVVTFPDAPDDSGDPGHPGARRWDDPAVDAAARWVFLLAGVSYYKTAAPPLIELPSTPLRTAERDFLRDVYLDGLGEFAYRNDLDLSDLRIEAPALATDGAAPPSAAAPGPGKRPLVPFGGGIDSIVTVELVRPLADAALFVVSRPGDRFLAIERPAEVAGLPVVRAEREIDEQVLRSAELGFLNGHVPVTGIISAIGVVAAALDGRDALVMSNEWSSSIGNLDAGGRTVNHQWSKSLAFETGFRGVLGLTLGAAVDYFSRLRPYTELYIAERFAALDGYHLTFQSCNRGFHIDPARRLDRWCGRCDKCVFIDLILAPFMHARPPGRGLRRRRAAGRPVAAPPLRGAGRHVGRPQAVGVRRRGERVPRRGGPRRGPSGPGGVTRPRCARRPARRPPPLPRRHRVPPAPGRRALHPRCLRHQRPPGLTSPAAPSACGASGSRAAPRSASSPRSASNPCWSTTARPTAASTATRSWPPVGWGSTRCPAATS